MKCFLVTWTGGYEQPSYQGAPDLETARTIAATWEADKKDEDVVEILEINLTTYAVERLYTSEAQG